MLSDMELGKTMSYALRHNSQQFGLTLDAHGFTDLDALLKGIRNNGRKYANVTMDDMLRVTKGNKRYEIVGNKIRALYGHSKEHVEKTSSKPPKILYHGTTPWSSEKILKDKILPMERQYVHLSANIDIAIDVAKRRTDKPVILIVDAEQAHKDGIKFFAEPNDIFMSEPIPAKYLTVFKE